MTVWKPRSMTRCKAKVRHCLSEKLRRINEAGLRVGDL